jgi:predicted HAD superfamily phosphohydrolase YqeG
MIDINHVDFDALKRAGYNAVVIDKDNCLVRPL